MKKLTIALFLGLVAWIVFKRWQKHPKSLYRYRRQPWLDHILDFLDNGRFYEAEEMCRDNIEKYPQVDEYKLLQIKVLTAAGNMQRAQNMIKIYLEDELEPGYHQLFTLYAAFLMVLEKKNVEESRQIFQNNQPPKKAAYYGLYDLWRRYLNNLLDQENNITDNFLNYPKATKTEQAERNYLAASTLISTQPDYAKKLLQKTIALAPKSYFARKAQELLKEESQKI